MTIQTTAIQAYSNALRNFSQTEKRIQSGSLSAEKMPANNFADVLAKKNATVSVRQIIRELEAAQEPVWSPMILNGSGYGMLANHSLVMANYISRANAAVMDLRQLLSQG